MQQRYHYDILIIGTGAAGLALALQLAPDYRIAILSKSRLSTGSTAGAQGGIAAVLDDVEDSYDQHIQDTLIAGAGLCHPDTVKHIVKHGRQSIQWLINQKVPFTPDQERPLFPYHLTREGGHSARRIIHAADATGQVISDTLIQRVQCQKNIDIYEHHLAIDLITSASNPSNAHSERKTFCATSAYEKRGSKRFFMAKKSLCQGAYVLDCNNEQVHTFTSQYTVLATGGASKAYLYTTNTDGATGDGIAMAWRTGCRVANMEFNQFHPTCLYHANAKSFLISEAVRGEGGILLLPNGHRFMPDFDSRAELAPRDIVARAIDHEMKRLGADCLFLDISHKPSSFIRSHFPTIFERCLGYGIDITQDPIPIVPAAHYTCGGVVVDFNGQTDTDHLFAIGECAFTGLHGANRLASNSLLECFVTAHSTAQLLNDRLKSEGKCYKHSLDIPQWDESQVSDSDENVVISHNWEELRRFMWDYVGIVRTTKRLQRAAHRISLLQSEIHEFYSHFKISNDLIELRNLAQVSELIIRCAMHRKESRGLHFTSDYPYTRSTTQDTILKPDSCKHLL